MADSGLPRSCCAIKTDLASDGTTCTPPKGGAYDLRIACIKYVTYPTAPECVFDAGSNRYTGGQLPSIVTINTTTQAAEPHFHKIEVRNKTLAHTFEKTYDPDTNTLVNNETITFNIDVKDTNFYCNLEDYIGQEVVLLFREKGTDRWYIVGRDGGITVNSITGGTGTDTFTPTTFTIGGTDTDSIFIEVFDTDLATTTTMIDGVTV